MKLSQDQIYAVEKDGDRTYAVNTDDGEILLPSVTTIINFVMNKPALPPWAFNTGVKSTLDYIKSLAASVPEGMSVLDSILELDVGTVKLALIDREATQKHEMERGGERGVEVHEVLEAIANGREFTYSRSVAPYVETLKKWVMDYAPEFHTSEFKVASLAHGYAGQFDGTCTIHKHPPRRRHESLVGKRVLLDIKTNSSGAVYTETHLPQVEAYRHAYWEMGGDGIEAALVVGIGPDGKYTPCISYARIETFLKILDLYKEMRWMKQQNPNRRT